MSKGPGESRLRAALRRWKPRTKHLSLPEPHSDFEREIAEWMQQIEKRLTRLERLLTGGGLALVLTDIILRVLDKYPLK